MGSNGKKEKLKKEREGLCFITKYGESFVITEYKDSQNVKIKFMNRYEKIVEWGNIVKNKVISPYAKTIWNIGYIGEGKFSSKIHIEIYEYWRGMIRRCYDPYFLDKHPTYRDCIICKEWLNFQNFAKWWNENYYNCNNERMELDKDILIKGNKIYSPETCIFVPKRINDLFIKCNRNRTNLPIGCHLLRGKIQVERCKGDGSRGKYLGVYPIDRPFQAFTCYKNFKESYIKQVADEYYSKGLIPKKLYEAMCRYEVEIND